MQASQDAESAPGGGTACYEVANIDPNTGEPIKMAWAFDASRTFDLSVAGGSVESSFAEFLTTKFGIEVDELNDMFWNEDDIAEA